MRKTFWCCAAAGVLLVGSLFLAARHASRHPDSFIGRCVVTASGVAVVFNPLAGVGPSAADKVLHSWNNEGHAEESLPVLDAEEGIPADPVPVEGVAVAVAEPKQGVVELPPEPPAAPIVIPEEPLEPARLVQAPEVPMLEADTTGKQVIPVAAQTGGFGPDPLTDGVVVPENTCPRIMPYCTDEDTSAKTMPYVTDSEDEEVADECHTGCGNIPTFWMKFFGIEESDRTEKTTEHSEPDCPKQSPGCQEDRHYHEHYSGCPHTMCPYTGRSYPTDAPKHAGSQEDSTSPVSPKKKAGKMHQPNKDCEDDCPKKHPDIDTMEFRPSDRKLNEFGFGPS